MEIDDASILSSHWIPAYRSPTGLPAREIVYDPYYQIANGISKEKIEERKPAMWVQCDDAHVKLVNLANANEIHVIYSGAHSYKVTAVLIGGTDCLIKQYATEKEADDFVKDLYQQLL